MSAIIECTHLQRKFMSGTPVLEDVNLTVEQGSVVGLVGRNGTGKSTLIKTLLGLLRPQGGEVRVFGLDPFKEPVAVRSRIGYVAEKLVFPAGAKVGDIFEIHRGIYRNWDYAYELELVARFGIDRGAKFGTLSKGQAQQASLICAIAHRPELLLLDEPAGGLDPAARKAFIDVYIDLMSKGDVTILLSSHDMLDVERICNEIAILHKGEILVKDDLAALREGLTLAIVPNSEAAGFRQLASGLPAFPGRERNSDVQYVLRAPIDECRAVLDELNGNVALSSLSLGDLFIELTGGAI